jgi:hypothetical protein
LYQFYVDGSDLRVEGKTVAENGYPTKKPGRQKPPLWADGRQAPRFEANAFLRAATANARKLAGAALDAASLAGRRSAAAFRDGSWQLPPERLGRTGRYLPDRDRMARTCTATARLAAAAGSWVAGPGAVRQVDFEGWQEELAANEPAAPSSISPLRYVRPSRGSTAVHAIDVDEETLATIRSAVHSANVMPVRPVRVPEPEVIVPEVRAARLPELEPAEPAPPGRAFRIGCAVIGTLALGVMWPAGAVQALLAHLRGEDLRDLGPV